MAIECTATVQYQGDAKSGMGKLSVPSEFLLNTPFSVASRFEGAKGTNPEELIAAALVNCFSTVLIMLLTEAGCVDAQIEASVKITLDQENSIISEANLYLLADVPNMDKSAFDEIVQEAGEISPVIKLLNTKITLDYQLTE